MTLVLALAALAVPFAPSDAEQERFLAKARVVETQPAPGGITHSKRITLSDGNLTHDAHLQRINRDKARDFNLGALRANFVDSWRGNVAAYRLDRMLGLGMTPVSIERRIGGVTGAVTWWVDDVLMSGAELHRTGTQAPDLDHWRKQNELMRIFDALIANPDRNTNNLLVTRNWELKLIDHTRAFRWNNELEHPHRVTRCSRSLFAALKALDRASVRRTMDSLITGWQVDALLARRDAIVARLEQLIAERGEADVLFDFEPGTVLVSLNPAGAD